MINTIYTKGPKIAIIGLIKTLHSKNEVNHWLNNLKNCRTFQLYSTFLKTLWSIDHVRFLLCCWLLLTALISKWALNSLNWTKTTVESYSQFSRIMNTQSKSYLSLTPNFLVIISDVVYTLVFKFKLLLDQKVQIWKIVSGW